MEDSWRPMKDAPMETPIQLKYGVWVCTGSLNEDGDHWTDGDDILHYNGDILVNGFRAKWDGWKPSPTE